MSQIPSGVFLFLLSSQRGLFILGSCTFFIQILEVFFSHPWVTTQPRQIQSYLTQTVTAILFSPTCKSSLNRKAPYPHWPTRCSGHFYFSPYSFSRGRLSVFQYLDLLFLFLGKRHVLMVSLLPSVLGYLGYVCIKHHYYCTSQFSLSSLSAPIPSWCPTSTSDAVHFDQGDLCWALSRSFIPQRWDIKMMVFLWARSWRDFLIVIHALSVFFSLK